MNRKASGMLVRAFVNTGDGVQLVDGTQMSDGGIWANDPIRGRRLNGRYRPAARG